MRFLFSPYGRTDRKGYWLFIAIYVAATIASMAADRSFGLYNADMDMGLIEGVTNLFLLWPSIAVSIRRLHDLGYSGWWILWVVLISIALLLGIIFAGSFLATDLQGLEGFADNPDLQSMPLIVWLAIIAFALPYLIQFFMLAFVRGEKDENQYDLGTESNHMTPGNDTTPPWTN